MKTIKFYLLALLTITLFSCSSKDSSNNNSGSGGSGGSSASYIISSYIRGNFYNRGRVSTESMNKCTDLICLGVTPAVDGGLMFETFDLYNNTGVRSLGELVTSVKSKINNLITLRLGVSGGEYWKDMVANSTAVSNFNSNILILLQQYSLDGVDIDFEWAYTDEEFNNLSNFITSLKSTLGDSYILSVSLSPVSYKISTAAIKAADYISLQCYGPLPDRFPYDEYVSNVQEVINYGITSSKLLPGLPFYGVTTNNSKESAAYYDFVTAGLITSPSQNKVSYNSNDYIFNGQTEILNKFNYAKSLNLPGVMCWDLADDVTVTNSKSLLSILSQNN